MSPLKKILFVRPTLGYGGADRVTLNLLKGFDRSVYDCDLALMKAEGEFLADLPEDVKLIDLKANSLWSMWLPLRRAIISSKYDVIYSTCGGASMPMMLAIWLSGFKGVSVVSERNILFPPKKNKLKRRLMLGIKKFLYEKATWITAVSKGVAEECVQILGTSKNKTIVVNNPIINSDLLEGKEEELDNEFFQKFDKIVLAIGRFEWQKDYDTMLNAFKGVLNRKANIGLFILGKGPLENHYKEKARDLGIFENVNFGGFDKNPFKYMKSSDVYVLSSRHEGMPGVLVQAMACGVACVSTDCPTGPNELIESGKNGFLVDPENSEDLARAIEKLLNDEQLRQSFSSNAPTAVSRFKEKEGVDSYFQFLET